MKVRPLTSQLAEKARLELNEDPTKVADDVQNLKAWIAKQPHLNARTDDQWLLSFLRGCKFSLEKTKTKLDLYYTMRSTAPDLTKAIKITDPKFMEILNLGVNLLLPSAGPAEPRVAIFRFGAWDPSKYSLAEVMCVVFTLQKITIMEDDNAVVAGIRSIGDLGGLSAAQIIQLVNPGLMKKVIIYSQDAVPFRLKDAHYINTPPGIETLYKAMQSLLNKKNKSRMFMHSTKNFDEIYKIIPKDILPMEYGGKAGCIEDIIAYWRRKVVEYAEFFAQEEEFGTDERKRVGRPKTSEDMFGLNGSFRRLQID